MIGKKGYKCEPRHREHRQWAMNKTEIFLDGETRHDNDKSW